MSPGRGPVYVHLGQLARRGARSGACQPPRVVQHVWTAGDAVLWDNRCLMHRGRAWDLREPRVMYHARIKGDQISEAAMGM